MRSLIADGKARLLSWRRVREFAVPALMIDTATARRIAGDWAGACAAAHFDVDLDLRSVASGHGRELADLVRADLRRLAPDLLRWHLPRIVSDGLLRPGLTMSLVRYSGADHDVHLVARTAPSWAGAGQRVSLALWDPARPENGPHPRPRPDRRFRLDLHPHLWAADRALELRERCGLPIRDQAPAPGGRAQRRPAGRPSGGRRPGTRLAGGRLSHEPSVMPRTDADPGGIGMATDGPAWREPSGAGEQGWADDVPAGLGYAVHRWMAEAAILRVADGYDGPVAVRLGNGRRLFLSEDGGTVGRGSHGAPVLPYAATWMSPDLELLQAGMIAPELLHPLVAEALAPVAAGSARQSARGSGLLTGSGTQPSRAAGVLPARDGAVAVEGVRLVECCGETHRLGLVGGRLTPLDHEVAELRREELLAVFGGPPLPCLRAIATAARQPECLDEVRTRLDHGDHAGAAALIVDLLGPGIEPEGALREAFADAQEGRIGHGLYRAGLAVQVPAGVTAPIGPRKDRAGRRGRHHRLPKRAAGIR
jgi:hypothetical protein